MMNQKAYAYIDVDGETVENVNSFKFLGSVKTNTASCSENIKAII